MSLKVTSNISDNKIFKDEWNIKFLESCELSKVVGGRSGCQPLYFVGDEDFSSSYIKSHSYGEYIFDWEWANAFESRGLSYYPKLVSMAPFSPVTVPNVFCKKFNVDEIKEAFLQEYSGLAESNGLSSCHLLFQTEPGWKSIQCNSWVKRLTHQYHWQNQDYASFDDFLQEMKNIPTRK